MTKMTKEEWLEATAKLRVNGKSLACESRVIRHEMRRQKKWPDIVAELQCHRVWKVRRDARATNLAVAFLRGRPYLEVERSCWVKPEWGAVWKKIEKVTAYRTRAEMTKQFAKWSAKCNVKEQRESCTV